MPPQQENRGSPPREPYLVSVSVLFLLLSVSVSSIVAFGIGWAARIITLQQVTHDFAATVPPQRTGTKDSFPALRDPDTTGFCAKTSYSGKDFSGLAKDISSASVHAPACATTCNGDGDVSKNHAVSSGRHLLMDIKDVDGTFLNSDLRLAEAMTSLAYETNETMLSYHCHKMLPAGVTCVGVLLRSHITFHTWPAEGVITLDFFVSGTGSLMHALPIMERLFGPRVEGGPNPPGETMWAHKMRGFAPKADDNNPLRDDLGTGYLEVMDFDYKREVFSSVSPFQRIDIWDFIDPRFGNVESYRKSISLDEVTYESLHPELFRKDRALFLDGVEQSSRLGNEAYHESLVHPGMFAHRKPRRVAIIGGGEGATLREVLKHRTVEKAVMVEIDQVMVEAAREYLPDWSDCSDLQGSADWCGDDPRADVLYKDALAWFSDRFGEHATVDEDPFDVIIMDALDPQDNIPFAKALYDNDAFLRSLHSGLSEEGVIVMQLGSSPEFRDPPEDHSFHHNRAKVTELIQKVGFESMHVYEEAHSQFENPWSYLVAFKDNKNRAHWYANPAEVEMKIQTRLVPTKSGASSLSYFDGATMWRYQMPHKVFETTYCRKDPEPMDCEWWEEQYEDENAPVSSFEVKISSVEGKSGRGVYATVDIPMYTKIGMEESLKAIRVPPPTASRVNAYCEVAEQICPVFTYIEGYGWDVNTMGEKGYVVDSGILTFQNHGCNGTYNVGHFDESGDGETEFTIDPTKIPKKFQGLFGKKNTIYSPLIDRHYLDYYNGATDFALRDIKAGEEILCNYVAFTAGEQKEWGEEIHNLRNMCEEGDKPVGISQYESE